MKITFVVYERYASAPEYEKEIVSICSTLEKARKTVEVLTSCTNENKIFYYEEYPLDTIPAIQL